MSTENKELNPMVKELLAKKEEVEKEIADLSEAIKERKTLLKRYDKVIEETTTLL